MINEVADSHAIANFRVTSAVRVNGSNAKTLGMRHLHFSYMGARGGPPDLARLVHHGTDELLIQQNSIPDAETSSTE
jgi:hypothetical protein